MLRRLILSFLLAFSVSAFAATPVTVSGTNQAVGTVGVKGNSFVRFRLRNFAGFVPKVFGTGIIVQTQLDVQPAVDGTFSAPIWSNDDIVPNTCGVTQNLACTWYTVEFWNGGKITASGSYCIPNTSVTYDLNVAVPCQTPPLPPGPIQITNVTGGQINGTTTHVLKFIGPTTAGDSEGVATGVTAAVWPLGTNIAGAGLEFQKQNSASPGTTQYLLAAKDPATGFARDAQPTDANALIGITHTGAGTTGLASIVGLGGSQCTFDNQTSIGDWVILGTASQCHDAGITQPVGVASIAKVTSVNAGAGTNATVDVGLPDVSSNSANTSSGGNGTVSPCATNGAVGFYSAIGNTIGCDPLFTDDGAGNVSATSLFLNGTGGGFQFFGQGTQPTLAQANAVYFYAPASVPASFGTAWPSAPGTLGQNLVVASVPDSTHIVLGYGAGCSSTDVIPGNPGEGSTFCSFSFNPTSTTFTNDVLNTLQIFSLYSPSGDASAEAVFGADFEMDVDPLNTHPVGVVTGITGSGRSSGSGDTDTVQGILMVASAEGSAHVLNGINGGLFWASIFGSGNVSGTSSAIQAQVFSQSSGNYDDVRGVWVQSPTFLGGHTGIASHYYGLYISDPTGGGARNPDPYAIKVEAGKTFLGGPLLFTNNAIDIGDSGATARPRTLYAGTSVVTPALTVSGILSQCLATNGSGLVIGTACGSGGAPGGSPNDLQYNNAGSFGGFSDGTSTQVLHGGRTFGQIVNADITNATIDVTTKLTGILPSANGGTANAFVAISGPASSVKTFALPNASATILTDNSAVTVPQGGTGLGSGTSGGILGFTGPTTLASSALLTSNSPVLGGGAGATPKTVAGITSDGVSKFTLGVAGVSVGATIFNNLTSGSVTLQPVTGALGTVTVSLPAATGTVAVSATAPITESATGAVGCPTCVVASSPGAGIAHFAGATQTVTSSAIVGADMTNNTVTATQLAAQYSKYPPCNGKGLGDGLNAVPAGTYLQTTCYNNSGVTVTLTGIKCFSDNNGSSTLNATNGAGTALLTGAVTCTNAYASGTQSATVTIASGDFIKFTFVADGTTKQTDWVVLGTY